MVQPATQPKNQSVYLVEDHELYALGLQQMIERSSDFSFVGRADNVLTAVTDCQIIQPDVMLLDWQLKNETGLSVIRALRAQGKQPLIAVMTSYNDPHLIAICQKAGANAFILKEEPLVQVLAKLRRMRPDAWEPPKDCAAMRRAERDDSGRRTAAWITLSPREKACMDLLAQGLQQVDVAEALHISLNTLKNHRKNIYRKMGFKTKMDLVLFCREHELEGYRKSALNS